MNDSINQDFHLRPRFSIPHSATHEALVLSIENKLSEIEHPYKVKKVDAHFFFDIPTKEQHYWSPQLQIEIVDDYNGASIVKGLFGPKPQVWTMFMFLHLIVGSLFIIFGIMWYVRWSLDNEVFVPMFMTVTMPIIWVALYFFGRWGRRQGKDQMEELYQLLLKTLKQ